MTQVTALNPWQGARVRDTIWALGRRKAYQLRQENKVNYEADLHQHQLLHDLADAVTTPQALDQAVSVLIEWGFIDADFGAEYINEFKGAN